jgi:hypothetical protein
MHYFYTRAKFNIRFIFSKALPPLSHFDMTSVTIFISTISESLEAG